MNVHKPGVELNVAESNPLFEGVLRAMGIWRDTERGVVLMRSSDMQVPRLQLKVELCDVRGEALWLPTTYKMYSGIDETTMHHDQLSFRTTWEHLDERGKAI